MQLTLFRNRKGLIHGSDPKRIECDRSGVLKIGATEISITAGKKEILPMLFFGSTGNYSAVFTTTDGAEIYALEKVTVHDGWIRPPAPTAVELMELRVRADEMEEKMGELNRRFDTNALNFLIN
ncbi:MAG: hypothetical protein IKM00_04150 [Clostridia bacterium]|nr:hypothetical protein [Clostridia bacterium]